MSGVSFIIPVIRPDKAARCIQAIRDNAAGAEIETVSAIDEHGIGCPRMVARLRKLAKYDLICFLGDDTIPQPGFLEAALAKMADLPDGWGAVGLATEDPRGANDHAHWLAHKKMLDLIPGGEFFATEYRHCFGDDELRDIATENGRWAFAEDAHIDHDHPVNGGETDDGYQKAYGDGAWDHDYQTYLQRKIDRTRERQGVKLAICWPVTDPRVYVNFVFSYISLNLPSHDFFVPQFPGKIDTARNDIVEQALRAGCTHIWMTDTDQIYHDPDTIQRLLDHDLPVVTAPVCRRYPPFDPILKAPGENHPRPFTYEESRAVLDAGELIEVEETGAACMMVDSRVFLQIDRPWFKLPAYGERGPGEDFYFCRKLRSAGIPIHVDCGVWVSHLTTMAVDFKTHSIFHKLNAGR